MKVGFWSQPLAIDFGTANTRIWARNGGPILREASAVAYPAVGRRPMAVGHRAKELAQR
ncbi:MAG: rod shape-determining protein, partial [Armatimonadetes bacterium]|nr:rod shape-determining protein [Armatimonadota bacterium]